MDVLCCNKQITKWDAVTEKEHVGVTGSKIVKSYYSGKCPHCGAFICVDKVVAVKGV